MTETIANGEGKKIIRNTLKDKEVPQEKATVETKTKTHSNNASQAKKQVSSSNNSSVSSQSQSVSQSFVANMSISKHTTQAITVVGNGGSSATLTVHTKHDGV